MKAFGGGDLLRADLSPAGRALTPLQCLHYALTRPAGDHTDLQAVRAQAVQLVRKTLPHLRHVPGALVLPGLPDSAQMALAGALRGGIEKRA